MPLENQKTGVRILFGVVIGMIALSMLLYLVPQGTSTGEASTDTVAKIGDQSSGIRFRSSSKGCMPGRF
jgi:hypothetical protein